MLRHAVPNAVLQTQLPKSDSPRDEYLTPGADGAAFWSSLYTSMTLMVRKGGTLTGVFAADDERPFRAPTYDIHAWNGDPVGRRSPRPVYRRFNLEMLLDIGDIETLFIVNDENRAVWAGFGQV